MKRKKMKILLGLVLTGCHSPAGMTSEDREMQRVQMVVEGVRFDVEMEENQAVYAFVDRMRKEPVSVQLSDYAGFEKVGPLGYDLPKEDRQMTTQPGDIVLYQGNQIVVFYGSNRWSYTKLGNVADLHGFAEALGQNGVTVTFELVEE